MEREEWDALTIEQKLNVVARDILIILRDIQQLVTPGGELDSALDTALESFQPVLERFGSKMDYTEADAENVSSSMEHTSLSMSKDVATIDDDYEEEVDMVDIGRAKPSLSSIY